MTAISLKKSIAKMHGETFVGSEKVCEGDFLAKIMEK
jgi:hypothetical protein